MFPSNTVSGFLHAYAEQNLFDHASNCSTNDVSFSYFPFSPTVDHVDSFLPYHQEQEQDPLDGHFTQSPLIANASSPATKEPITSAAILTKTLNQHQTEMGPAQKSSSLARKRGSKKDRHSKIYTAHGPRDRRMRLSLEIARRFFDLQDMLGFDKASKTVDWLLTKSKGAIKEVARGLSLGQGCSSGPAKSMSSASSEGEVISGVDESRDNADKKSAVAAPKAKRTRQSRKATFNPHSKEWRANARARARERTRKKMMMEGKRTDDDSNTNDQNQLPVSLSPHETGEESKSSSDLLAEAEELTSSRSVDHHGTATVNESLPVTSILDYHHQVTILLGLNSDDFISHQNNDMINFFPDYWNMDGTRAISQSQLPDSHLYTKPWELYNHQCF